MSRFNKKPHFRSVLWQVLNFGGQFCPIFGQEKDDLLTLTVRTLLDKNSSN